MPRIFISYRRADSQAITDRIHDRVAKSFGDKNVFQDVFDIKYGLDFRQVLQEQVRACDVLLVIIGTSWATIKEIDEDTGKDTDKFRLFNPDDFVRIEVETGLKHHETGETLVIPVLVNGAATPSRRGLPESLHPLTFLNAVTIRNNPYFDEDITRLIKRLKEYDKERRKPAKFPLKWLGFIGLLLVVFMVFYSSSQSNKDSKSTPQATDVVDVPSETPPRIEPSDMTNATETPTPTDKPSETPSRTPTPTDKPSNTPIPIGYPGGALITANAQWEVASQDFDGVEMVLVPAGCFTMGSASGGDDDERPTKEICFDSPFWIDQYEVTNAQFADFGGQAASESNWTDPNRPREMITWFEARDFCELRGGRLPTEAEWEYAARGPDNLIYPWGDEFIPDVVVYGANSNAATADVGSRSGGASWVGALDMSGNVWEWTSTIYGIYDYTNSNFDSFYSYPYDPLDGREQDSDSDRTLVRVRRGGAWYGSDFFLRAAYRYGLSPDDWLYDIGFRCVRLYSS